MRHLGSIVLSIVLAPIIYLLVGVGEIKFATNGATVAAGQSTNWTAIGIGVGALVVAGALFATLVMARISPLGPVIAAILYIAVSAWAVESLANVVKLIGSSTLGVSGAQEAPLSGVALFMAVPLLATIFSPRRWRGKDKPAVAAYVPPAGTPAYPTTTGYPTPTSSPDAAPTYGEPAAYGSPAYPTPSTAAPTYGSTPAYTPTPNASAPTQLTPETAADAQPVEVEPTATDEEQ
jgi:hypothetical protein